MSDKVNGELPTENLRNALKHVLKSLNLDPDSEYTVAESTARVFASRAYKVLVSLDNDGSTLPMFVKCLRDDKTLNESLDMPVFFNNEVSVYNNVLGPFLEFQKRKLGNVLYNPGPICHHAAADGENDVFVFEDLEAQGFRMLNRLEVMPVPELKLLLRELGRFHGLSLAVKRLDPVSFEGIKNSVRETVFYPGFFEKYGRVFEFTGRDGIRMIEEVFPDDADNTYVRAMRRFAYNMCDSMAEVVSDVTPEYEEHYVITHGDLWINNFMFRYPEGSDVPDALRIVDYQVCRYGSPALDVSCIMFSTADKPTRDLHGDLLLRTYHDGVCDVLVNLGLDPGKVFPYATLQRHLVKYSRFAIGMCVTNLPQTLDEREGSDGVVVATLTPDDPPGSDPSLAKMSAAYGAKSERCRRWIVDNIVEAVDRGYLK